MTTNQQIYIRELLDRDKEYDDQDDFMKSEDITAIASSVIAVTLIIGTVVYFQKEGEKKRLRQERIEQMQLRMKKEKAKYVS